METLNIETDQVKENCPPPESSDSPLLEELKFRHCKSYEVKYFSPNS